MSPQIGFNLLKYYLNFQHSKKQQRYKFLNIFMNLLKPSLSTNGCNRLVGYSCKNATTDGISRSGQNIWWTTRWEQTVSIWVHGYTVLAYSIDTNSTILSHVVHVKLEHHNRPHIPPFLQCLCQPHIALVLSLHVLLCMCSSMSHCSQCIHNNNACRLTMALSQAFRWYQDGTRLKVITDS